MLSAVRIQNFKCLRDTGEVQLEPVTVLIGKNDTGKSSFLRALWLGRQLARNEMSARLTVPEQIRQGGAGTGPMTLRYEWSPTYTYEVAVTASPSGKVHIVREHVSRGDEHTLGFEIADEGNGNASFGGAPRVPRGGPPFESTFLQGQADLGDLSAIVIAEHLARMSHPFTFAFRASTALSSMLDDMVGEDRAAFDAVEAALCAAFPDVRGIVLRRTVPAPAPKTLMFRTSGDAVVSAEHVSGGVVAFTAMLAEVFRVGTDPRELLLIEEPENGIHPRRLPLLAKHLKELSKRCQIILATHSPYFLDLFPPEAVRVFGRKPDGDVVIKNMAELPLVQEWLGAGNSLGEMWFNVGEDRLLGLATDEAAASE